MKLRVLIAVLAFGVVALAAETGAELFQKAVTQERAAGNLEEAIKLYERVAKEFASDRPLAARALIQAARCYEKLGLDKATKIYEQVARDFSDQTESANTARARLAALKSATPPTMSLRRIELGAGVRNIVGTDGQRAVYWDEARTTLFFGDLGGKNKQAVYKVQPRTQVTAHPARDLSTVFLEFSPTGPFAVVRTDGTGYRDIALHFRNTVPTGGSWNWSWDNRYVLRIESEADNTTKLQRISIADGSVVDVLSGWKKGIVSAVFSPDGRFIAFMELGLPLGNVYVLPAQGGEPRLVAAAAGVGTEWTRDGRYLLIAAERSGAVALFALPIQNGQAAGERVFIRDFDASVRGIAPGGALVLEHRPPVVTRILLSTQDGHGHIGAWEPLDLIDNASRPVWSPDGSRIAYVARQIDRVASVVRIYDVLGGRDRELYRSGGAVSHCLWANRHPSLYCFQASSARTELLSVSLDSGQAEQIGSLEGIRDIHALSPDDRLLHVVKFRGGLLENSWWEIGTDREVADLGVPCGGGPWAYTSQRVTEGGRELAIQPQAGGEWKRLTYLRTPLDGTLTRGTIACAPDGNSIFYRDRDTSGGNGLYRISTSGGEPDRLGDYPADAGNNLAVSSKGQILIDGPAPQPKDPEFWLLENFEPRVRSAK